MRIIIISVGGLQDMNNSNEMGVAVVILAGSEVHKATQESMRQVTSNALLSGQDALAIHHHGERYVLRLTRAGKLILTK